MTDQVVPDSEHKGLVARLPQVPRDLAQLARFDRPIGWWLLLLPGWWAIALSQGASGGGLPNIWYLGLFLIGASLTNAVSSEKHLRMQAGDRFELAGYEFVFEGTTGVTGPNFVADRGEFIAYKDGEVEARLYPEKRRYRSGQVMTEAALDPGLTRDLYVSLGEPLDNRGEAWAVRLYHKPFIRFIWLGGLLIAAGQAFFRTTPHTDEQKQTN